MVHLTREFNPQTAYMFESLHQSLTYYAGLQPAQYYRGLCNDTNTVSCISKLGPFYQVALQHDDNERHAPSQALSPCDQDIAYLQ